MASYYDLKTIEERRAWMQAENRRRCELATARRKADPAATLDDLRFAVVEADGPKAEPVEWELNPKV